MDVSEGLPWSGRCILHSRGKAPARRICWANNRSSKLIHIRIEHAGTRGGLRAILVVLIQHSTLTRSIGYKYLSRYAMHSLFVRSTCGEESQQGNETMPRLVTGCDMNRATRPAIQAARVAYLPGPKSSILMESAGCLEKPDYPYLVADRHIHS